MMDITKEDLERLSLEELKRIENTLDNYLAKARASNITIDKDPFITSYKKALLQFHDTQSEKVLRILELVLGKEPSKDLALTEEQVSNIQIQLNMLYPQWLTDFLKFKERYTREMYRQIRSIQSERVKGVLEAENPELKKAKTKAGFSLGGPDERVLRVLGNGYIFPSCPNTVNHFGTLMEPVLRQGLENNKSVWQVSQDMRDVVTAEGPNFPDYWYDRISRTETALLTSQAQQVTMDENEISWYDWITGPGPCSGECEEMHQGGPYRVGEGPLPVQDTHPNCLCDISPITPFDRPDLYGGEQGAGGSGETGTTEMEEAHREFQRTTEMTELAHKFNLEFFQTESPTIEGEEQWVEGEPGSGIYGISQTIQRKFDVFYDREWDIRIKIPQDLKIKNVDGKFHLSREQFLEAWSNQARQLKDFGEVKSVYYTDIVEKPGTLGYYQQSTKSLRIFGNVVRPVKRETISQILTHELAHGFDHNLLKGEDIYHKLEISDADAYSIKAYGLWKEACWEDSRFQRKPAFPGTPEWDVEQTRKLHGKYGSMASRYASGFYRMTGRLSEDFAETMKILLSSDEEVIEWRKGQFLTKEQWIKKYPNRAAVGYYLLNNTKTLREMTPQEFVEKIKLVDIPEHKILNPGKKEVVPVIKFDPEALIKDLPDVQYIGLNTTLPEKEQYYEYISGPNTIRIMRSVDKLSDPAKNLKIHDILQEFLDKPELMRIASKRLVLDPTLSDRTGIDSNRIIQTSMSEGRYPVGILRIGLDPKAIEKFGGVRDVLFEGMARNLEMMWGKYTPSGGWKNNVLEYFWKSVVKEDGTVGPSTEPMMATADTHLHIQLLAEHKPVENIPWTILHKDFVESLKAYYSKADARIPMEYIDKQGKTHTFTTDPKAWRETFFANRAEFIKKYIDKSDSTTLATIQPHELEGFNPPQGKISIEVNGENRPCWNYISQDKLVSIMIPMDSKLSWNDLPDPIEIHRMVKSIPKMLTDRMKMVVLADKPNTNDAYWTKVYGHKFESAATASKEGVVTYYPGGFSEYSGRGTLSHELGHLLDNQIYTGFQTLPSGERKEVYFSDYRGDLTRLKTIDNRPITTSWVKAWELDGKKFVSSYAEDNYKATGKLVEQFAEATERYVTRPGKFKSEFPNQYHLLQELFGDFTEPIPEKFSSEWIDFTPHMKGDDYGAYWKSKEFQESVQREMKWGQERFHDQYLKNLTAGERSMLINYQGGDTDVNDYLRFGEIYEGDFHDEAELREIIKRYDAAIEKAGMISNNMVLYRYFGLEDLTFQSLKVGDSWVDKGYMSTSLDKHFVEHQVKKSGAADWIATIHVNGTMKGIHMPTLDMITSSQLDFKEEREILLQRNVRLTVKEIDKKNKTIVFEATLAQGRGTGVDMPFNPKVQAQLNNLEYKGIRTMKEQAAKERGRTLTRTEHQFVDPETGTSIYIPITYDPTLAFRPDQFLEDYKLLPKTLREGAKEIYWSDRPLKEIGGLSTDVWGGVRGDKVYIYMQNWSTEWGPTANPAGMPGTLAHELGHLLVKKLGVDQKIPWPDQQLWKEAVAADQKLHGGKPYYPSTRVKLMTRLGSSLEEDFVESIRVMFLQDGETIDVPSGKPHEGIILTKEKWIELHPNRAKLAQEVIAHPELFKTNPLQKMAREHGLNYVGDHYDPDDGNYSEYKDPKHQTEIRFQEGFAFNQSPKINNKLVMEAYQNLPEQGKEAIKSITIMDKSSVSATMASHDKYGNIIIYGKNVAASYTNARGVLFHEMTHVLQEQLLHSDISDMESGIWRRAIQAEDSRVGHTTFASGYSKNMYLMNKSWREDMAESFRIVLGMEPDEVVTSPAMPEFRGAVTREVWVKAHPERTKAVYQILTNPGKYGPNYEGEGLLPLSGNIKPVKNVYHNLDYMGVHQLPYMEGMKVDMNQYYDPTHKINLFIKGTKYNEGLETYAKMLTFENIVKSYEEIPDFLKVNLKNIEIMDTDPGNAFAEYKDGTLKVYAPNLKYLERNLSEVMIAQISRAFIDTLSADFTIPEKEYLWADAVLKDADYQQTRFGKISMASLLATSDYRNNRNLRTDLAETIRIIYGVDPKSKWKLESPFGKLTKQEWMEKFPNRVEALKKISENPKKYGPGYSPRGKAALEKFQATPMDVLMEKYKFEKKPKAVDMPIGGSDADRPIDDFDVWYDPKNDVRIFISSNLRDVKKQDVLQVIDRYYNDTPAPMKNVDNIYIYTGKPTKRGVLGTYFSDVNEINLNMANFDPLFREKLLGGSIDFKTPGEVIQHELGHSLDFIRKKVGIEERFSDTVWHQAVLDDAEFQGVKNPKIPEWNAFQPAKERKFKGMLASKYAESYFTSHGTFVEDFGDSIQAYFMKPDEIILTKKGYLNREQWKATFPNRWKAIEEFLKNPLPSTGKPEVKGPEIKNFLVSENRRYQLKKEDWDRMVNALPREYERVKSRFDKLKIDVQDYQANGLHPMPESSWTGIKVGFYDKRSAEFAMKQLGEGLKPMWEQHLRDALESLVEGGDVDANWKEYDNFIKKINNHLIEMSIPKTLKGKGYKIDRELIDINVGFDPPEGPTTVDKFSVTTYKSGVDMISIEVQKGFPKIRIPEVMAEYEKLPDQMKQGLDRITLVTIDPKKLTSAPPVGYYMEPNRIYLTDLVTRGKNLEKYLPHEAWHQYEETLWSKPEYNTLRNRWREAMKEDPKGSFGEWISAEGQSTQDISEDMADSFRYYFLNKDDFRVHYSNRNKLFEQLFSQPLVLEDVEEVSDDYHRFLPVTIPKDYRHFINKYRVDWYADNKFIDKYAQALTEQEVKTVNDYRMENKSREINEALRNNKKLTAAQQKYVTTMDKALSKVEAPENFIAFRGVKADATRIREHVGDTITWNEYTSTSLNLGESAEFASRRGEGGGTIYVIQVPKGSKGIQWESVSKLNDNYKFYSNHKAPRQDYLEYENEWILPRDSQFEVLDVKPDADTAYGNMEIVTLKYLGQKGKTTTLQKPPDYAKMTIKELHKEMEELHPEYKDKFGGGYTTGGPATALFDFKGESSDWINAYLDGKYRKLPGEGQEEIEIQLPDGKTFTTYKAVADGKVAMLETVFKGENLKKDLTVYSGVRRSEIGNIKEGDVFQLHHYRSTSVDKKVSGNFARGVDKQLLEIKLPAKAEAVVSEVALKNYDPARQQLSEFVNQEGEVMLNKNSWFRVEKISGRNGKNVLLQYLGSGEEYPAPEAVPSPVESLPRTKTGHVDLKKLTPEQFRNLEFDREMEGGQSWTPKEAMDYRETGWKEDHPDTLHSVINRGDKYELATLFGKDYATKDMPDTTKFLPEIQKKMDKDQPITVYRASDTGGIIPGSFVTESRAYAKFHGENYIPGKNWKIYEEKIYPDELMWQGDPHEFIYIPRDPKLAFKRIQEAQEQYSLMSGLRSMVGAAEPIEAPPQVAPEVNAKELGLKYQGTKEDYRKNAQGLIMKLAFAGKDEKEIQAALDELPKTEYDIYNDEKNKTKILVARETLRGGQRKLLEEYMAMPEYLKLSCKEIIIAPETDTPQGEVGSFSKLTGKLYMYPNAHDANIKTTRGTLYHELAHALDEQLGKKVTGGTIEGFNEFSDSKAWIDAVNKDKNFSSTYAYVDFRLRSGKLHEDFAEAVKGFFLGEGETMDVPKGYGFADVDTMTRKQWMETHKNRVEVLRKLFGGQIATLDTHVAMNLPPDLEELTQKYQDPKALIESQFPHYRKSEDIIKKMNDWSKVITATAQEDEILKKYTGGGYLTHISSEYPKGMEYAITHPTEFKKWLKDIDKLPEGSKNPMIQIKYDMAELRRFWKESTMTPEDIGERYLAEYKKLDDLINRQKIPENVTVYRGNGKHGEELAKLGVGAEFHLTNINSGSLDYFHALMFEDSPDQPESGDPWIQGILLRKDDPVLQSEAFHQAAKPKVTKEIIAQWTKEFKERDYTPEQIELAIKQRSQIFNREESEVLFPLGTKFKIVYLDKENNIFYTEPIYESFKKVKPAAPKVPNVLKVKEVESHIPNHIEEFKGRGYGMNKPIYYQDTNGIKWHVKATSDYDALFNQVGLKIANEQGVKIPKSTYLMKPEDLKTKLPDVYKELGGGKKIDKGLIEFTEHIDGAQTVAEFAGLKPVPGHHQWHATSPASGGYLVNLLSDHAKELDNLFVKDVMIGNHDGHMNNHIIAKGKLYNIDDGMSGSVVRNDWIGARIFAAVDRGELPGYRPGNWERVLGAWVDKNFGKEITRLQDLNLDGLIPDKAKTVDVEISPGKYVNMTTLLRQRQQDLRREVLETTKAYYMKTKAQAKPITTPGEINTFIGKTDGVNHPIVYLDVNGVKWHVKEVPKSARTFNQIGMNLAQRVGTGVPIITYNEPIKNLKVRLPGVYEMLSRTGRTDTFVEFTQDIPGADTLYNKVVKPILAPGGENVDVVYKRLSPWKDELDRMFIKDVMIGNVDGHFGNYMIDQSNKLWNIDDGAHANKPALVYSDWGHVRVMKDRRRIEHGENWNQLTQQQKKEYVEQWVDKEFASFLAEFQEIDLADVIPSDAGVEFEYGNAYNVFMWMRNQQKNLKDNLVEVVIKYMDYYET